MLSRSIANARVDLNPQQINAALFALRSPFTNGAILADEVGLGKTVEAGIVLSQHWAERRRRILIVVPAMLRKQWQQELSEKFFHVRSRLKLIHQKQLCDLERRRNGKRRELFDAQDAIAQQREELIGKIEKQLKHTSGNQTLFIIRWRVQ